MFSKYNSILFNSLINLITILLPIQQFFFNRKIVNIRFRDTY